MSFAAGAIPAPNAAQRSSDHFVASNHQHLLQAVVRVSQGWVARLSVYQSERQTASRLVVLAGSLISNENSSSLAIFNVRTLLCGNCRSLNAARGQCPGQSLDNCRLLQEPIQ